MKIGIVGTSYWTQRVHGAGASQHPEWELVSIWGRSLDKANAVADQLGCAATSDYDAFLASVDAVAFAVPPDVQATLALRAAQAGKHLLLEKPLALSMAQAEELAGAVAEAGVANVVFTTNLWIPDTVAHLERLAASAWDAGRFSFLASVPEGLLDASPWRAEKGALWDVGPHVLSVLERVLGHVDVVTALAGVRDLVHLSFRHASGATSSASLTLTAAPAAAQHEFGFWGPQGHSTPVKTTASREESVVLAYAAALTALAAQIRDGVRDERVGASYGRHVVRVLTAAQTSLETGSRVAV